MIPAMINIIKVDFIIYQTIFIPFKIIFNCKKEVNIS
jgi:hypothetical protein